MLTITPALALLSTANFSSLSHFIDKTESEAHVLLLLLLFLSSILSLKYIFPNHTQQLTLVWLRQFD